MGVQLLYGAQAPHLVGQPGNDNIKGRTFARRCESASIDFGIVVSGGSSDGQCVAGGSTPIGIAMRNPARGMVANDAKYLIKEMVDILDGDDIYVNTADAAGSYGDPLHYTISSGLIGIGAASTGEAALPGFLAQDVSAAGIVRIHVDSQFATMIAAVLAAGLAVAVPPHAASHANSAADEISVEGLSGVLAEGQNATKIQGITVGSLVGITNGQIIKYSTSGTNHFAAANDEVGS
jgi:hypothetical protein